MLVLVQLSAEFCAILHYGDSGFCVHTYMPHWGLIQKYIAHMQLINPREKRSRRKLRI